MIPHQRQPGPAGEALPLRRLTPAPRKSQSPIQSIENIWECEASYPSLDAAFRAADEAIARWLEEDFGG